MVQLLLVEHLLDVVVVYVAHRHEILFGLVLYHERDEVLDFTSIGEEYLALAILHIFLYVQGYSLEHAEVLHVLGDGDAHLLGQLEIVVYGMARGEDHSCIIEEVYFLLTKLFCG